MKFEGERGIKTARWVPNVLLRSDDITKIGSTTYSNLTAVLATLARGAGHVDNVVVSGLSITHVTDMTAKIDAGIAVSYTGRYLSGGSWGFVASAGDVFSVVVGDNQNIAFLPGGSLDRIDIVEIRPVPVPFDLQTRNFKDPITGVVSSALLETQMEYGYEFAVRPGTEGSGVAPVHTPGWVKVAEVFVGDGVTSITDSDITGVVGSSEWTSEAESVVTTIYFSNASFSHDASFTGDVSFTGNADFTGSLTKNSRVVATSDATWVTKRKLVGQWMNAISGVPNNAWNAVTSSPELGILCAVAASAAMVSFDGLRWVSSSSGVLNVSWQDVTWSPELGLFCAVALSGSTNERVMVSPDGMNWTNASSGVLNNEWNSVTWSPELGLFCAVARTGSTNERVMVSPDGLNWTNASSGVLDNNWNSVTWSPGLGWFVAVASSGSTNERVMLSPDGMDWTNAHPTASGVLDNSWRSVTWAPGLGGGLGKYCAVAQTGTTNGLVMTSDSGIVWENASSGVLNNEWIDVTWSPELGLLCVVALSGSTNERVMTSPDGFVWSNATSGVLENAWNSVTWSPELGLFCAVTSGGSPSNNRVMIS